MLSETRLVRTPMKFANATATAAMVPVWTTKNSDQPKRKPVAGPPTSAEDLAETIKMPEPIIDPMTIIVASRRLRPRTSRTASLVALPLSGFMSLSSAEPTVSGVEIARTICQLRCLVNPFLGNSPQLISVFKRDANCGHVRGWPSSRWLITA